MRLIGLPLMPSLAVFQSTHPLGVRLKLAPMYYDDKGFNPRTHSGCDKSPPKKGAVHISFNPRTHSGCDKFLVIRLPRRLCFNPRTHSGCDIIHLLVRFHPITFQSTHPLGVRPKRGCYECCFLQFQSTHPLGVRLYVS